MAFEVRIPTLGESITEGTITQWRKREGEAVAPDEVLLELETDKANNELTAERGGVLHILKPEGTVVTPGDVVATIDEGATARPESASAPPPRAAAPEARREPAPLGPAVRHMVAEHHLDPATIPASGKGGRLTKADVVEHLERDVPARPAAQPPARAESPAAVARVLHEGEEAVPMSRIRKRIAERLVQAQHTAAILTTFNEIDMSAIIDLRARHKERFQKTHSVGLGFMSFFAHACISALRDIPAINAEIRGDDIVYKHFVHLGVAVGTERGLVVPVIHHADRMTFAEVEREILRLAGLAREGRLSLDDLSGGTFTISNGGVYGSLLSTPILNPPQSGILGMHKIEKRPIVVDDEIVIRPMMYVALSYDHRIVDGGQAVTFLVRVKERIEDPARMLLSV
jgi:2-oxoglutarate dehydrogenase E2 component (dihydrolipoamide succinyltransferase)